MAESTRSEGLKTGEKSQEKMGVLGGNMSKADPLKTEHVQGLEKYQIHLSLKNAEITSNREGSAREKEQYSSHPMDNVPSTEDEKRVEKRRRFGVVEANDTAQAERRKAGVFSKKFGEGMIHEKPSIFNKKL